ncbi:GDSL esterase/lipase [Dorcoceras hygrometricum]|uniref:GDSL esterase/lipase n=1 Tax=Dorcoceras hygrometricum TaxID=472368 RepID=A0A2Z7AL61_9LAMI|nr:GDSL esterase/lipase [Dorcoceras hygrometricum]
MESVFFLGKHSLYAFLIALSSHILPCFSYTSFVFGDSLVDGGNNNYLFTLSKADAPPYGIDFKPSGGQPTGRFTNGRTIPDIVGEAMGGQSYPPPYLAPNAAAYSIQTGINYASGASGILDDTGTLFIGRLPLKEQINNFVKTREYIVGVMGVTNTTNLLKNAIFSITTGSNDVINYFQPIIPFLRNNNNVSPNMFQDFLVSNLTVQLERLYVLGARKVVVVGVGPLGCIPFIRAIDLIPSGECSGEVNALVQGYNQKLKEKLYQMNRDLWPSAVFVYANSYDIFRDIILNHHIYGFEDNHGPCCGGYFPPFVCYEGRDVNSSSSVCSDRKKYVFWDAYHPTEAANLVVADQLLNGDKSRSYPMNIRELYNYDIK